MLKIKKQLYTLARIINLLVNKPATYYLLFSISAILMGAIIVITISNGLHYPQYYDDYNLLVTYQNHGIFKGTLYLFTNVNGRLVSHFLSLCVVPAIASSHWLVAGFYLANAALFILSFAFFLNAFFTYRYALQLSVPRVLLASSLLYTLFFFFFFAKRFEFWYFISAVFIYQHSIILTLVLNALLLKEPTTKATGLSIIIISLCLGFMSENNAVGQLLILSLLLASVIIKTRKLTAQHKWQMASAALIALALVINFLSPGAQHKVMISKTQFTGLSSYIHGISIFTNDLLHHWDHITILSPIPRHINSLFIQIPIVLLLAVSTPFFTKPQPMAKVIIRGAKYILTISFAALIIFVITYLLPAVLYANILDTILDRCKFFGCFVMFLALFHIAGSINLFPRVPKV